MEIRISAAELGYTDEDINDLLNKENTDQLQVDICGLSIVYCRDGVDVWICVEVKSGSKYQDSPTSDGCCPKDDTPVPRSTVEMEPFVYSPKISLGQLEIALERCDTHPLLLEHMRSTKLLIQPLDMKRVTQVNFTLPQKRPDVTTSIESVKKVKRQRPRPWIRSVGRHSKNAMSHYGRKGTRRRLPCGKCEGCRRDDCRQCKHCADMRKYGGRGVIKKKCVGRLCSRRH